MLKVPFTLLRITFGTDQKAIRSSVDWALQCQLYEARIKFDPLAKRVKSDTANRIGFATDC